MKNYYDKDKTYSYKAVFYSTVLAVLILLFTSLISCSVIEEPEPEIELKQVDREYFLEVISLMRKDTIRWYETLEKASAIQTDHMEQTGEFAHVWSDGTGPYERLKSVGYTGYSGECIAWGQEDERTVLEAWMFSEGHRKTIMDKNINCIGVTRSASGKYWTLVTGRIQ